MNLNHSEVAPARPLTVATKPRTVSLEVYPSNLSQGIHRVARALALAAPEGVRLVGNPAEADLRILHVIGWGSIPDGLLESGQDFAILQYCVRTSEDGRAQAWLPYWEKALCTWSYYDLRAICEADGVAHNFPFMYAPLGVDPIFKPSLPIRKRFIIGTSGYIAETEGVKECYAAARATDHEQFHLGPNLGLGPNIAYATGISDAQLAELWSQCSYVAGMRRHEGFELPAYEGLLCGARPVMFDAPHYQRWMGDLAEYVPEGSFEEVTEALTALFSRPVRAVREVERIEAARRFSWPLLCGQFWERILS